MKGKHETIELTLCSKCASVYFNDKDYFVRRADTAQTVYEECMMCRNPHGYDFFISCKSTMRIEKSHHCGGEQK